MNKNVPTLLGVAVILLVVVLAVLAYNIKLTTQLASGGTVVGTAGGQVLTGVQQPTTEISPSEALGREAGRTQAQVINPQEQQREHGRLAQVEKQHGRDRRQEQRREAAAKKAEKK